MARDRGKQQAYCKVCSKHFSVSHGGIDDVRRHGEGKKHLELFNGFFKKITDFPRVVPHFFFQKLNMSACPDIPVWLKNGVSNHSYRSLFRSMVFELAVKKMSLLADN